MESDRYVRAYLVWLLRAMGHAASGVGDLEALSRRVARRAPDAVLCDANPQGGDGIEVCRSLRLLLPDLPLMIMAWDVSLTERARRAALGPVLVKPFSPMELRDALTFVMFSVLKTSLRRAVSDLEAQNRRIRADIEGPKGAASGRERGAN